MRSKQVVECFKGGHGDYHTPPGYLPKVCLPKRLVDGLGRHGERGVSDSLRTAIYCPPMMRRPRTTRRCGVASPHGASVRRQKPAWERCAPISSGCIWTRRNVAQRRSARAALYEYAYSASLDGKHPCPSRIHEAQFGAASGLTHPETRPS